MPTTALKFAIPADAERIICRYRTCEFSTLAKNGTPITRPMGARWLADGRFLLTTSIGMPQKAFHIRRDPKVSLLFSEPMGSGIARPGAVLVRGNAVCDDRIVSDSSSVPELEDYLRENIFARQPAGRMMSSLVGRLLAPSYYMRLLIYVTPVRMDYWPDRNFAAAPEKIEVDRVG